MAKRPGSKVASASALFLAALFLVAQLAFAAPTGTNDDDAALWAAIQNAFSVW